MRKRVMKAREKDVPDKDDYFFQLKKRVERERERRHQKHHHVMYRYTRVVSMMWLMSFVGPQDTRRVTLGPHPMLSFWRERERERELFWF